jgi:hypothetical protein
LKRISLFWISNAIWKAHAHFLSPFLKLNNFISVEYQMARECFISPWHFHNTWILRFIFLNVRKTQPLFVQMWLNKKLINLDLLSNCLFRIGCWKSFWYWIQCTWKAWRMMILAIRDTRKKYFESFCSLFIVEKLENQL